MGNYTEDMQSPAVAAPGTVSMVDVQSRPALQPWCKTRVLTYMSYAGK